MSDLVSNGNDVKGNNLAIPNYYLTVVPDAANPKRLLLRVPELKPSRDFDILLIFKLSQKNIELAKDLNREIYRVEKRTTDSDSIFKNPKIIDKGRDLREKANDSTFSYKSSRYVFHQTLKIYYDNLYAKTKPYLDAINDTTTFNKLSTVSDPQLKLIGDAARKIALKPDLVLFGENLRTKSSYIAFGYTPLNYAADFPKIDPINEEKRIANLDSTIRYFTTFKDIVSELSIYDPVNFAALKKSLVAQIGLLQKNRDILKTASKQMASIFENQLEARWLTGNSGAKDLQAQGKNYFSMLAGIAYGAAKTNSGEIVQIPKLFLGLNINFRALNKDLRPLKDSKRNAKADTAALLTRRDIWHFVGLNVGLTLGPMKNNQFDNFYANTSLTIGPSVRVSRLFRVSAGPMFLNRTQKNPLSDQKKATMGGYVSIALDIDFLEPVTRIVNMVFK
ncbi:hypothetical protein [Dyadobacter sp. 32]|uniref:hypothetical protein n=1 Tax=Dyadobacter sp. 32 TaxID=538966 RepID=UPI0011EEE260